MSSSGWRAAVRVLAVVLGAAWVFVALVAGSFLGWSSETLGWLWSGIAFAIGLVLAVLMWRPASRRVPLVAVAVVALVLGLGHWWISPPTHDRIAGAADDVNLPAEWTLQSESLRGNTWCFKGCPQVDRIYTVPGSYDDAMAAATEAFEDAGWTAGSPSVPGEDFITFREGRWSVSLFQPMSLGPTEVSLSFSG